MKIIFDFDHTLFSTKRFFEFFEEFFSDLGIEEKLFKRTFQESKQKSKTYNPQKHLKLIAQTETEVSLEKMENAFGEVLDRCPQFLFPDVRPCLIEWSRYFDFYIFSFGKESFQKRKIGASQIEEFFEDVITTSRSKKDSALNSLLEEKEKAVLIDDNPQVLVENKKHFPNLLAIRINRGEGRYAEIERDPRIDFSIENLGQLEEILGNLR